MESVMGWGNPLDALRNLFRATALLGRLFGRARRAWTTRTEPHDVSAVDVVVRALG
jgi:hypothetical protein